MEYILETKKGNLNFTKVETSLVVALRYQFYSQGGSKRFTCFLDSCDLHGERKGQNHEIAERGRMYGSCLELGLLLTILDT